VDDGNKEATPCGVAFLFAEQPGIALSCLSIHTNFVAHDRYLPIVMVESLYMLLVTSTITSPT
jgi:hypothetical protein